MLFVSVVVVYFALKEHRGYKGLNALRTSKHVSRQVAGWLWHWGRGYQRLKACTRLPVQSVVGPRHPVFDLFLISFLLFDGNGDLLNCFHGFWSDCGSLTSEDLLWSLKTLKKQKKPTTFCRGLVFTVYLEQNEKWKHNFVSVNLKTTSSFTATAWDKSPVGTSHCIR